MKYVILHLVYEVGKDDCKYLCEEVCHSVERAKERLAEIYGEYEKTENFVSKRGNFQSSLDKANGISGYFTTDNKLHILMIKEAEEIG